MGKTIFAAKKMRFIGFFLYFRHKNKKWKQLT